MEDKISELTVSDEMQAVTPKRQSDAFEMSLSSSEFLRYDVTDKDHPAVLPYQEEINETPENIASSLEILRRDLRSLKDIEACLEEDFLVRFLRVAKFDTAKAFQRVKNYYMKTDVFLEMYKKVTFPLEKAESLRHVWVSPYRCQNNSFLILGNCGIDYRKYTWAERFFLEVLLVHGLLENPVNQICGGTYILDYDGFDIHGYIASTPTWIRTFLDFLVACLQMESSTFFSNIHRYIDSTPNRIRTFLVNVFPCRLKAVHIVNVPALFQPLWKIATPFLSKKIQTRFFLYTRNSDWSRLHAHVSPDILPERYGGRLKESELINGLQNMEELEEKFHRLVQFGNIKTKSCRQALKILVRE